MSHSILSLLILIVSVFFFVTRLIPLGITAVLASVAMATTGIITFNEAFSSFGSDTVMLILGMIVVGNALTETGCTDIIGKALIKIPGISKSEKLFLIVVITVVAMLSGFMSNTATVAIFLPLIASIAKTSAGTITKKNTFMAVGMASIIGGNLTLAGSTPQIVAQGILTQTDGCEPMTFFLLSKAALPLMITMLVYFFTMGYILQKKTFHFDETADKYENAAICLIDNKKAAIAGLIFLFCVIAFATEIATLGTIAIVAACACIITGCITVDRAAATMDWTSIMVLGGSLGFSKGLAQSGALQMLADNLINLVGAFATPFRLFALFLILTSLIGNFLSSTATAAIMIPIAIKVALEMGSNPTTFSIGIVIACSLSLATPVSTPPLTMTLIGGYRFSDYLVIGGILSIACMIIALVTLPLIYGL